MQSNNELVALMRRNNELLTILVKTALSDVVERELKDPKKRKLYEFTGKLTVREISKKTGIAAGTISETWQEWEQLGLLIKDGRQYRKALG